MLPEGIGRNSVSKEFRKIFEKNDRGCGNYASIYFGEHRAWEGAGDIR